MAKGILCSKCKKHHYYPGSFHALVQKDEKGLCIKCKNSARLKKLRMQYSRGMKAI